jgi:predicted nuclease of predicted toxin-antitoxin system
MIIWIDAQFSPRIASWIKHNYPVDAVPLGDLGQRDAEDRDIFEAAKTANAVIMTKDSDFSFLLDTSGTPPQIILGHLRQHIDRSP